MDNIQLYFYYFQWQTAPAQTCSSISSQHYSWQFVPFKTLLLCYPCFCSENTENTSLAEKSPMLFTVKKSFLRKHEEKHIHHMAALSTFLSAFSFPWVSSLPVLQEHLRLLFLPSWKILQPLGGDKDNLSSALPDPRREASKKSVLHRGEPYLKTPNPDVISYIIQSYSFLKVQKGVKRKGLVPWSANDNILIVPVMLISSLLNTNFNSFAACTWSEDREKKLWQSCKLLHRLGFLCGSIWNLL